MNRHEDEIGVVTRDQQTELRLPDRFARSLGYLDWETQPDAFRSWPRDPGAQSQG